MAGGYRVLLTRGAHADLNGLERHRRGRLTMWLGSVAAHEPPAGLLAVRSWVHLAACEVLERRRLVLVYAILDRHALQEELLGPKLSEELKDRQAARFMHGRR